MGSLTELRGNAADPVLRRAIPAERPGRGLTRPVVERIDIEGDGMRLRFFPALDYGLLGLTGLVVALYTYALFWRLPYAGFEELGPNGEIQYVWIEQPDGVRVGDRVLANGDLTLDAFRRDLRQPFWAESAPGAALALTVGRGDVRRLVTQPVEPFLWNEFTQRLLSQWFLAWFFWLAGVAIALIVRPRDTRWRLLILFQVLTALWLSASTLSRWHVWESALLLRVAIWLSVPVYWHLHWLFPTPLRATPVWLRWAAYLAAVGLAVLEALQWVPQSTYTFAFVFALLGIGVGWIWRALRRERLPGIRLILAAVITPLVPVVIFSLVSVGSQATITATALSLLALPLLPMTYVYMAGRRQLGGLELWANRALAAYLYAMLVMLVGALAAAALWRWAPDTATLMVGAVGLIGLGALASPWVFPPFQRWVERVLLGLPLDRGRMLETYVGRIVASTDLSSLIQVLRGEVLPSLLVRQSALYRFSDTGEAELVFASEVEKTALPAAAKLQAWRMGEPLTDPGSWVRLPLVLTVDDAPVGLLLLGAHDPDDVYTRTETATLRALADQTAIALAHAIQTEQLRTLFQANIERHEAERAALARDLHDDILQQMAVLAGHSLSPAGDAAYASIVSHTRQMISGLRPVMLDYGLNVAIEQLADDLAERSGATPEIRVRLEGDARYPGFVEQHAFRIVQQATGNALRHAGGTWIEIKGTLTSPECLTVWITDDGRGIPPDLTASLGTLIAQRHFGLAGMVERAQLIGAALTIQSLPQGGAAVSLQWPRPKTSADA